MYVFGCHTYELCMYRCMYLVNDVLIVLFVLLFVWVSNWSVHGWIRLLWNAMADTTCTVDIYLTLKRTRKQGVSVDIYCMWQRL